MASEDDDVPMDGTADVGCDEKKKDTKQPIKRPYTRTINNVTFQTQAKKDVVNKLQAYVNKSRRAGMDMLHIAFAEAIETCVVKGEGVPELVSRLCALVSTCDKKDGDLKRLYNFGVSVLHSNWSKRADTALRKATAGSLVTIIINSLKEQRRRRQEEDPELFKDTMPCSVDQVLKYEEIDFIGNMKNFVAGDTGVQHASRRFLRSRGRDFKYHSEKASKNQNDNSGGNKQKGGGKGGRRGKNGRRGKSGGRSSGGGDDSWKRKTARMKAAPAKLLTSSFMSPVCLLDDEKFGCRAARNRLWEAARRDAAKKGSKTRVQLPPAKDGECELCHRRDCKASEVKIDKQCSDLSLAGMCFYDMMWHLMLLNMMLTCAL